MGKLRVESSELRDSQRRRRDRPWQSVVAVVIVSLLHLAPAGACTGDCDGDGAVDIIDLVTGVNISFGTLPLEECPSFDRDRDERVSVDELIAAVGYALDVCSSQTRAFVITSNFAAGSFATIDLDAPRTVSGSSPQRRVYRDAVVRTRDDLVYVINRRFGDNLQVLDPSNDFRTRLQCSTGNGTNPHDIAFAGDDKAYITLFEATTLLIVNPAPHPNCSDFVRGTIDLSAFADADGVPDMDLMAVVGDRLYVALERLDINTILRLPAGKGAIAVIDIGTDTVVDRIDLSGENPFSATKGLTVWNDKLYVAQAGRFNVMDGGIERIDLATHQAEGFFVTEADLGGDVTDFVLVSDRLAYAIVSRPGFSTALVGFDPMTRMVTRTVAQESGYTLFDIELNDRGELFLADRTRQRDGVGIYRAADGIPLADRIDVGVSPFEIVFF